MYIKQEKAKGPYTIVITNEEMREAFKSPEAYEAFRSCIMTNLLMACRKEIEERIEGNINEK